MEVSAPRVGRGRRPGSRGAESAAPAEQGVAIVAPLTGVFYAAPSPTSSPFVQVGDTVQVGQVVCIVEAMKVFNEITSEVSGTVMAMPAQAGQLVHQGDVLIRVQPA
jgi:acetyl-CoA carboxylase biotin carboxyl carrier protein